ncbi:MAG: PAS domain-containing protein [Kofleriaceae bacterium]
MVDDGEPKRGGGAEADEREASTAGNERSDDSGYAVEDRHHAHWFLDAIFEHIPDMVFVKEAKQLAFTRFNRAGEELLGLSRDRMLGKTDFDFFPPSEAAFFQAKDRETLNGKVLVEILEEPIQTQQGQRWLHTKKVPILDEAGEPQYLLGISRDITERKRVDTELREAKAYAEAAHRELEAFSYSVAHDLRSPLLAVDALARMLRDEYSSQLDDRAQRLLGTLRDATQRMAQLVDDLIALSRVTQIELRLERMDLTLLATTTIARLQHADPGRRVDVTVAPGMAVTADSGLIAIALDNLLGNAWKFTSKTARPHIELGTMGDDTERLFFVRDNGAGFDTAHAEKLFGVFQRLHTESEFPGTGIGLATVDRIIRRHGGRIWAAGSPGNGATFYFTLGPGA